MVVTYYIAGERKTPEPMYISRKGLCQKLFLRAAREKQGRIGT